MERRGWLLSLGSFLIRMHQPCQTLLTHWSGTCSLPISEKLNFCWSSQFVVMQPQPTNTRLSRRCSFLSRTQLHRKSESPGVSSALLSLQATEQGRERCDVGGRWGGQGGKQRTPRMKGKYRNRAEWKKERVVYRMYVHRENENLPCFKTSKVWSSLIFSGIVSRDCKLKFLTKHMKLKIAFWNLIYW